MKEDFDDIQLKQEMRSWIDANAKFPSTAAPAANMISSAGLLFQSHLDLSDPTMYSAVHF